MRMTLRGMMAVRLNNRVNNIINDERVKDIFDKFPNLDTFWVKGNLNTFYATFIVTDDNVSDTDILDYLGFKYDTFSLEFGLVTFNYSLVKDGIISLNGFTECRRKDYV